VKVNEELILNNRLREEREGERKQGEGNPFWWFEVEQQKTRLQTTGCRISSSWLSRKLTKKHKRKNKQQSRKERNELDSFEKKPKINEERQK